MLFSMKGEENSIKSHYKCKLLFMTTVDLFKMCERLTYPDDRTWEQKSPDN